MEQVCLPKVEKDKNVHPDNIASSIFVEEDDDVNISQDGTEPRILVDRFFTENGILRSISAAKDQKSLILTLIEATRHCDDPSFLQNIKEMKFLKALGHLINLENINVSDALSVISAVVNVNKEIPKKWRNLVSELLKKAVVTGEVQRAVNVAILLIKNKIHPTFDQTDVSPFFTHLIHSGDLFNAQKLLTAMKTCGYPSLIVNLYEIKLIRNRIEMRQFIREMGDKLEGHLVHSEVMKKLFEMRLYQEAVQYYLNKGLKGESEEVVAIFSALLAEDRELKAKLAAKSTRFANIIQESDQSDTQKPLIDFLNGSLKTNSTEIIQNFMNNAFKEEANPKEYFGLFIRSISRGKKYQLTEGYMGTLFNWMLERKYKFTNADLTSIFKICRSSKDWSSVQSILPHILSQSQHSISLYNQMIYTSIYFKSSSLLDLILERLCEYKITLSKDCLNLVIKWLLSVNEIDTCRKYVLLASSQNTLLDSHLVQRVLREAFNKLPLSVFFELFEKSNEHGYHTPKEVYEALVKQYLKQGNFPEACRFILCQVNAKYEILPNVINSQLHHFIINMYINEAHRIFQCIKAEKSAFHSLLSQSLQSVKYSLVADTVRIKTLEGVSDLIDYCTNTTLIKIDPHLCNNILSQAMENGNLYLARKIFDYLNMQKYNIQLDNQISLWKRKLQHINN